MNLENSTQYFEVGNFKKTFNSNKGTNFFHMNISSLSYNFDQPNTQLSEINIIFDVMEITHNRLKNKH